MKVAEKLFMDKLQLLEHGAITIVVFGDSVTHGAVAGGEFDYETVYWNRLRKKLLAVRDYVPVNVINSGIGGATATSSLGRVDTQVLNHLPDLIIVCFGLNDINRPLEDFVSSLNIIFEKCVKCGADVIYMTPNMLNTYVCDDVEPQFAEYAAKAAENQNGGKMDAYMEAAKKTAEAHGVRVCDCYSYWKKLSETEDTTLLLANRINHPTKEMHEVFAQMLFDVIMEDSPTAVVLQNEDAMYKE